jgi:arogenate dehydrogenase (NADP+), plant
VRRVISGQLVRDSRIDLSRYSVAMTSGTSQAQHPRPQTIAIVGFGNFGQFLCAAFAAQGHRVVGCSRGDYGAAAAALGCEYVRNADALLDADPDVVVLCTSIMSLSSVLAHFPVDRLAGRLVVDVLSVKMYPHNLLLEVLPASADLLCTHPMFGPESARDTWAGLPFVYDVVRCAHATKPRCDDFVELWELEGCKMVPMSCKVHDECAASTQFITHTTGRMLAELDVKSTPINTLGYESLLGVVDNTTKDSFDLFYGLYKYNPNASAELDNLEAALRTIRRKLERAELEEQESAKGCVSFVRIARICCADIARMKYQLVLT